MNTYWLKRGFHLLAILTLLFLHLPAPARSAVTVAPEGMAQRILIKVRPGVTAPTGRLTAVRPTPLTRALAAQGVTTAQALFHAAPGTPGASGLDRIYRLELAADADLAAAVAALNADPAIEWAEPDYIATPIASRPSPNHKSLNLQIPADPLFPQQWGLTQIAAPDAWDVVTGTPTVVIAVVDSGLDLTHPDLAANLWINPGEIADNGLDDDNNGYVDDTRGWNFVSGSNDVSDGNGHGTQVAGVAAAAANNGAGIAGVCWNCRIMPVKVMADSGVANYSDIALGVRYAADKGAEVINLSLGGYAYSNALREAVDYAVSQGAVVVGGAGNDATSALFYPAAYESVLAIAGTLPTDAKWGNSNYGPWVDVSAPAAAITTTFLGGDWGPADGTSLATAFAAGLAGLVRAQHPDWNPAMARAQVVYTADPLDALNPGYAGQLGAGRINAAAAVTQAPHPILEIAATTVDGDPLGRPTPGETATLAITLRNAWLDAAGVSGTLSTADPYVTVVTATATYGAIPAGSQATPTPAYRFTSLPAAPYNHPIPFTLTLTANDGAYTVTLPLTITTRSADYTFCGTIAANQTWTSDKTYIIACNIGIAPGYTLTIQPGTVVHFNGNYSLNVGGTLVADGTSAFPIRFMSHTGGNWGRIYFDNQAVDATTDGNGTYQGGNILRWVQMEDAAQGIGCNSATPYLEHVTTDDGEVNCTAGNTPLWLQDSDLTGNVSIVASASIPEVTGSWTTRASMPTARLLLGAATANGKIYAIGGGNDDIGSTVYDTVEVYDPATNTWTARASMPTARRGLGAVLAGNGKIYTIGGYNGGPLATVEEYDPSTNIWTARASMPTARRALGVAAADNGKVYAIGGGTDNIGSTVYATVEAYDPATDTWTTCASMPTARHGLMAVAASNGKVYAMGGLTQLNGSNLATVEEYDPATNTWTTRASMPTALHERGVIAANNGKIYAMGGCGLGGFIATVDEYNPATDIWITRASMPTTRSHLAVAAADNGRVYAIGGLTGGNFLATNEEFTPPTLPFAYRLQNTTIRNGSLILPQDSQVLTSTIGGNITAGDRSDVQNTTAAGGGITINGGGVVADSTANGAISLGSGTARNNTVNGGGISIGSGSVLSNTLRGGGISAGSGSTVRGNDVENASGWGIEASGGAMVAQNRVVGGASGVNATNSTVSGNLIANSAGVALQMSGGTVTSNTLTGNGGNAIVVAGGAPVIRANNLEFNHGAYDLVNNTANPITATLNWWGTTAAATIDERIYDYWNDFNLGQVTYTPLLTGPAQDAPAYVRAVTVSPNPVGIETATFEVLFSREMDTSGNPQTSFLSSGQWVTRTSMPTARHTLGVAAAPNGKLYAIGGIEGEATVEEYDPATDTWATRANMPTARHALGVAAAPNGKLYAIGGRSGGSAGYGDRLSTVEEYDPATDTWATRASMPTARYDLGVATASNGKLYAIGGDDGGGYLATVEEYDPATDTWAIRASMPTPRMLSGITAASNGRIYVIGGYSGGGLAVVEEYDPATNTWATRASIPAACWGLGAVAASNSKVYAIGGAGSGCVVEEYDPATDTWVTRTNMYTARYAPGAAEASNGKIYVIGGQNIVALATVEEFTLPFKVEEFSNPQWLSPIQYHTSYDFSTLIPRSDYTITVSDAIGADGIKIVPNTAYTFTVDYAGAVNDTTPPPAPTVTAGGAASPDTLAAHWSVADPDSAITLYRYAIGTTPGGTDVVNWTTTPLTATTRASLTLTAGQRYYFSVKARNEGGLWSAAGVSGGILAGSGGYFVAAPSAGMSPLAVTFTPHPTGTVTAYRWDFGDGFTSTQAAPVHTYTVAGPDSVAYVATLDVFGSGGWSMAIWRATIFVAPDTAAPAGALTLHGGASVVATTMVGLDVAAGDPSGLDDMRFSNDGVSYAGWVTYTRTYSWTLPPGDGLKTVYAQVRDLPGNVATFSDTLSLDTTPPTAAVAALPAYIGTAAFTVSWAGNDPAPASGQAAGLASFDVQVRAGTGGPWTDWRVGVAQTSAIFTGVHGQTYTFRARARDTLGNLGQYAPGGDTHTTVDLQPPVGSVTINDNALYTPVPTVTLTLTATDGLTVTQMQISHSPHFPGAVWLPFTLIRPWNLNALASIIFPDGEKAVFVRYRDAVGNVSTVYSDTIILDTTAPTGSIVIQGGAPLVTHTQVLLTLSAADTYSVAAMRLRDGQTAWGAWEPLTVTRSWTLPDVPGLQTVWAQFRDAAGNPSAACSDTIRYDHPVAADFTAAPLAGQPPLTVVFTDTSTGAITAWQWAFGDGLTSTQQHPTHEYATVGTYTVTLTVSGPGGRDVEMKASYIRVSHNPVIANFIAAPTEGVAPLEVQFTDVSAGAITRWVWDFGDTLTSTQQNPAHVYTQAGMYTVSLQVSGPDGSDTLTRAGYITVTAPPVAPVADFTASPLAGAPPLTVVFTDTSTGTITAWQWTFGDGLTSTQQHPTHDYTAAGTYTVTLTVNGPGGSDSERKASYIRVSQQGVIANFTAAPTEGNVPLEVHFTDVSAGNINAWMWDFGDTVTSTQQNPAHLYTQAGIYTVSLQVSGPGGSDALARTNYIRVTPAQRVYLPLVLRTATAIRQQR